jgi:hypothetical protein
LTYGEYREFYEEGKIFWKSNALFTKAGSSKKHQSLLFLSMYYHMKDFFQTVNLKPAISYHKIGNLNQ